MLLLIGLILTTFSYSQEYKDLSCKVNSGSVTELAILVQNTSKITSYLDYMSKSKFKYRCDMTDIENKKEVIIAIDGANAYRPYTFESSRIEKRLSDSKSKSINKSLIHWKFSDENYKKIHKEMRTKSYSPFYFLFPYGQATHNKFYYFSHSHYRKALKCIRKIKKEKPEIKIKLLAYSWGGNTAQKLANKLEKENIEIASVLTIDPVRKGFLAFGVIRNITSNNDSPFFKKNKNIKKYYNIFQKTDEGSLAFIKIKGNSVVSADQNIALSELAAAAAASTGLEITNPTHLNLHIYSELFQLYNNFLAD